MVALPAFVTALLAAGTIGLALVGPTDASASSPSDQPPFGGEGGREARSAYEQPEGFELSARRALEIAQTTSAYTRSFAEYGMLTPRFATIDGDWEVVFSDSSQTARAAVLVADPSGEVLEQWTGWQVETRLARGYPGAVGGIVGSWWIWLPLTALFFFLLADLRKPLSLRNFDLLVLVAFGVSFLFFSRGQIDISVPLVYPLLAWLFVRLTLIGFGRSGFGWSPVARYSGRGERGLELGVGLLALGYLAVAIFEAKVIDVGFASVIGAHLIATGDPLYGASSSSGQPLLVDVYGPVNYLAYLPFERIFPWDGRVWDSVPAARYASLVFTLATAGCLYGLGRRIASPEASHRAGLLLAVAWLAFPFTLLTVASSFNDSLVALLVSASLLAISSAAGRGALSALAGLTKFGPLAIAPLFAAGTGERRLRSLAPFALAFLAVCVLVVIPVVPDGGLREIYDRSLGYQAGRGSPFSLWGQAPSLEPLQTALKVFAVGFSATLYFLPRRRSVLQVAALASAALIALEVCAMHWFYPYLIWILPGVLIALTLSGAERDPTTAAASARSAR